MTEPASPNHVREGVIARRFVLTIELVTPNAAVPFEHAIRPLLALAREVRDDSRIDAIALTDRSRSDHDHDPIVTGHRVAEQSGKMPIVHWAGKDRTLSRLDDDMRRAVSLGLANFLLVTGDKVRQQPVDRPVRYVDSVNALAAVRQRSPEFLLAAAVSPFKYREEELVNQYLKAIKKLRAGADLLITQIGWDPRKYEDLRRFLLSRGYDAPLIAEVLLLTPARGRRIRRFGLPGVTITADLAQRLEEAAGTPDDGRGVAFRLLALQILNVRDLGYSGAQVSGIGGYPGVTRLMGEIETLSREFPTPDARQGAWRELLLLRDGRTAQIAPAGGLYLSAPEEMSGHDGSAGARAEASEWIKYRSLDLIDRLFFAEEGIGARALAPVLRRLDPRSGAGDLLLRLERTIKSPLLGCRSCGFCRLPHTSYVCPETCPKGLANGPCGGTRDNVCEFGDRECVHNQIYRISKRAGHVSDLEEVLIPSVPEAAWDSCSWVTHFRGEGPQARRLPTTET